jgi:hypothetical protein
MKRVEVTIRRLVVHGRDKFDTGAFSEALQHDLTARISGATRIARTPSRRIASDVGAHVVAALPIDAQRRGRA